MHSPLLTRSRCLQLLFRACTAYTLTSWLRPRVSMLQAYCIEHSLPPQGTKADLLELVALHIAEVRSQVELSKWCGMPVCECRSLQGKGISLPEWGTH